MFELKRGTANLEGTCYFEFVKNSNKLKTCWNEDAYYLEDRFFRFYHSTFKEANDRFDPYRFNKFNQYEIQRLITGLSSLEVKMKNIKEEDAFKRFFEKVYFYVENDGSSENWKEYIEIFRSNSIKIRELAAECLEEKQALWILGI